MEIFANPPSEWSRFVDFLFPWGLVTSIGAGLLAGSLTYWRNKVQREAYAARQVSFAAQIEAQAIEQAKRVQLNIQAEERRLGRPLLLHEMFYIQAEVTLPPVFFAEIKDKAQQGVDGDKK